MNIEQWTIGPLARRTLKLTFKNHVTVVGSFTIFFHTTNEKMEVITLSDIIITDITCTLEALA